MMETKRGFGWAVWTVAVITAAAVAYPLSMGPALGANWSTGVPSVQTLNVVYGPLRETVGELPQWARNSYGW